MRKKKNSRKLNGATVPFTKSNTFVLKDAQGVNRDVKKRETKRSKRMVLLL